MCLAYDVVWRPNPVMLPHLAGPWRPGPTPLRQPTWGLTSGARVQAVWSQQAESRWVGGAPVMIPTLSPVASGQHPGPARFPWGTEPSPTPSSTCGDDQR